MRYPLSTLRRLAVVAACLTALLGAPLAAQQEAGADDFRLTYMGGTGSASFTAIYPAVAYNPTAHEYLVVWEGDSDSSGQVDNVYQVFGQLLDAATGSAVGPELVISTSPFELSFTPDFKPVVAWDATNQQYLVVWSQITGACCELDFEVFARRLSAIGAPLGGAAQISEMTDTGNLNPAHFDAYDPAVAYNPAADEFLVVWSGDDGRGGRLNEEFEIYGQRLAAATGAPVGADDFRISDAGGTGNTFSGAYGPSIAYNAVDGEYLVVWGGEDLDAGTADGEFEVYGQRLAGATGAEVGGNDFRITTIGPPGDTAFFAGGPALAYDPDRNEYLVAFTATETVTESGEGFEIYAQRLAGTGAEIGANDFRITDVGGLDETFRDADMADVVYSAATHRYLVGFRADDDLGGQADGERETFVQAIDAATGAETGPNDLRVSDMGPNGVSFYQTAFPAVAAASDGGFLVVWRGGDDSLADGEYEIFGQRLLIQSDLLEDGFEGGNTTAWSATTP